MAFTFQTGNAAGLRRLPLYLLGAVATFLVPRTARLWAFGSGIGPGEGALALLRLARAELPRDVRLVWLATTPEELGRARDLGLDAELKHGRRGLWLTLRARVLVVTHGLGDVNRYATRGGFVVQLWHGIPLKKLHLDATIAQAAASRLARAVVRRGYRTVGRQIDLFPVAGEPIVARIASAFGTPRDRIAVTGDPRDDVLLDGTAEQRRVTARGLLEPIVGTLPKTGPLVLYAPTWRDGEADPAAPDDSTWERIGAWLAATDGVLIVRNHPLGRADYSGGPHASARIRLLDATQLPDLTPALPACDQLVTDYSSVAYDFALTDGTTVFLAADVDNYLDTRGLYEPYDVFTGGRHVASWEHALDLLDALTRREPAVLAGAEAHRDRLRDEHFDHLDGRATARVLALIRARLAGTSTPSSVLTPTRPTVTDVQIAAEQLTVDLVGADTVAIASLDGPRERIAGDVQHMDDVVRVRIPLLVSRWGAANLALRSGDYRLDVGASHRVAVATGLPTARHPMFRARALAVDGALVIRIGPPLADDEIGIAAQRRLRLECMRPRRKLENAVYFESFYGRAAADNPAAIDRVLARVRPEIRRYWSVGDRSVPVPPGAVPIVEYSREWWRVRAEARVYVINDWLRWTYRKRRGQRVLQTWHGTMLKRLALDRPGTTPRTRFATVRQSWRWNVMLAQNDYSARIFRTSYAFRGPIWQTGYPRNDVFVDAARAGEVRGLLGLSDDAQVVLYAPTWRDDRTGLVDYLDLVEFAAALPANHVLLVRGHSRTLGHGQDMRGDRLVDVTSYPDVAELMLVADLLVTDYSSVMFDFAATGKPMIFYTPDFEHYSDVLRGFYFDLLCDAPGPVAATHEALLDAIRDAPGAADKYSERYAAWRAKFTPHDDGQAAERVVARMLEERWFD
jgi:CDP-glycerol glycerophosphotransferase